MVGRLLLGMTGFAAGVALAVTLSAKKQLSQDHSSTFPPPGFGERPTTRRADSIAE